MSFRDMIFSDNENVFLNTGEFAEEMTFRYDGKIYRGLPVVFTRIKEKDLAVKNAEGLIRVSAVLYFSLSAVGYLPERGTIIEIENGEAAGKAFYDRYDIITSSCEGGLVCLELGKADE